MSPNPGTVLLAAPRGYCAGVERAVDAVERALAKHGAPVYVRKQIVHNLHVVRDLESKGAVFVDEETEVPEGAVVVLSAHGVAPSVYENAERRDLEVIDATCPLVTKVHVEARRFADQGRTIVLIGHEGHEEVEGTSGQAPQRTILVQSTEDARTVDVPDPENLSYLTQTTLSVDETNEIVRILERTVPVDPRSPARRHLLRDTEPAGRCEGDRPEVRRRARDRIAELLELESPRRALEGARHAGLPRRRRGRRRPGMARGRRHRRPDVRCVGARMAGAPHARPGSPIAGSRRSRR